MKNCHSPLLTSCITGLLLNFRLAFVIIMLNTALCAQVADVGAEPAVRNVLTPFDFQGVVLDGGLLKAQIEDARRYYLAIPDDDLLKPYRERAGLDAPGNTLGGWYAENRFNVFGQIVSGLARLHAATGDPQCREKALRLVSEWARCIDADGYFFAAPKPHAPHYIYDKFLWGLLDAHLYCGSVDSLRHMSRITDWAEKNLDRSRPFAPSPDEWYTLSENLYRAYLVTGEQRYRDFAQVWEYPQYWRVLAQRGDIFTAQGEQGLRRQYHAYSHVNCLSGAIEAYRVTGQPWYLAAATQGYEFLNSGQLYATGGYGPDEKLLPVGELPARLQSTHNSFETQCGCWAAFKLTRELIALTGDAQYGDWAERLSINGIGGTMPMTPDGKVLYYSDYNLHGGEKFQHRGPWSCCTGTRPQAVAELNNLAWFHDKTNLYLNLFAPSTVRWTVGDDSVVVREQTTFPEDSVVVLLVSTSRPRVFAIKLRIPRWLSGPMSAQVNNREFPVSPDAKHWGVILRKWQDGDKVTLSLPMAPWTRPFSGLSNSPYAVLVGPTVLVAQTKEPLLLARLPPADLLSNLRSVSGKPLNFRLASHPAAILRPWYALPQGERYYMHIDPNLGSRIHHRDLSYTGMWNDNWPHHVTTQPGASVQFEFEGRGFRWFGNYYNDAGRAEVSVDGKVVGIVDQFAPSRGEPFMWGWDNVETGKHSVRITLLPEANPLSKNRFINISQVEFIH